MMSRVNPNYDEDDEKWGYNCQRCVVAMELQERGYDVEAMPYNPKDGIKDSGIVSWAFPKGNTYWWKDPELFLAERRADIPGVLKKAAKEYGDGSRAILRVQWMSKYGGNGHFYNVRFEGGKAVIMDAQSNERIDLSEKIKEMTIGKNSCWIMRVDNREVTDKIVEAVKNREG